ncbi:MAG: LysM peptidoglycan-binding domain-containing protein [Flavobacteriaceae bacterium]
MGIMRSKRFLLLFILIPIFGLSQNPDVEIESDINIKFIEHNVKRKQTLFTISNLYNVPIDLIKKYNPQIKGDKISKRMVLKIPFITRSDTEKVIKETLAKQVSKSKNKKT